MKRYLILAAFFVGCGTEDEPPAAPRVTSAMQTYFEEFELACQMHKAPCNFGDIVVRMGDFDRAKPEKSSCKDKTVTIDRESSQQYGRQLLFHELGHCTLGRKDDGLETRTIMGGYGKNASMQKEGSGPYARDHWKISVADLMTRDEPTNEKDPLDLL